MTTCPFNELTSAVQLALARALRGRLERELALDSPVDDAEWVRVLRAQAPTVTDADYPGLLTLTPGDARRFQEEYAPLYLFRAAEHSRPWLAWLRTPKV